MNKIILKRKLLKTSDICLTVENCDIDKISEYFIKLGKEKKFPDLSNKIQKSLWKKN